MSVTNNNIIIYVPESMAKIINREKIRDIELTNINTLKKFFSIEDIKNLYLCNKFSSLFLSNSFFDNFLLRKELSLIHISEPTRPY